MVCRRKPLSMLETRPQGAKPFPASDDASTLGLARHALRAHYRAGTSALISLVACAGSPSTIVEPDCQGGPETTGMGYGTCPVTGPLVRGPFVTGAAGWA